MDREEVAVVGERAGAGDVVRAARARALAAAPLVAGASAVCGIAAALLAGAPRESGAASFLAASTALVIAACFAPFLPSPGFSPGAWAGFVALGASPAIAGAAAGADRSVGRFLLALVLGSAYALAISATAGLFEVFFRSKPAGRIAGLAAAALSTGSLFVSAAPIEALRDSPLGAMVGSVVLRVNPLAALAGSVYGVDWLRRRILYDWSPLSALPFQYPDAGGSAALFLAVALAGLAIRAVMQRRREST